MNHVLQLGILACVMLALMTAGWVWQRRHRNAGIVDVLWAAGLGMSALWMAATGSGGWLPRLLVAILGAAWSVRLALHLWQRVRDEEEDGRYRYLRSHWKGHQGKFLAFFLAQAALVLLFSLPFMAVAANPTQTLNGWAVLGVIVWVGSVAGEAIADRQLARYRRQPESRTRTYRGGLWHYSRHPNYFFEWLHWFSYVALAVGSPLAWLAWLGPVVMLGFLRWLSGIPFTEAQALRSRGEDYRDYQRSTPMLFPWFPKPVKDSHEHDAR